MIDVKKIKKYYGKNRGVEEVSFAIQPGETYGLIGPNGAGKTTTIRVLLGLLKKDKGSVQIGGKDIPHDMSKIKNKIGYLPGEINFYSNMKVSEFLRFNRNFYPNIDINYERELCELVELDTSKRFKDLSTGNKKKVGIVQALVHKPEYLILDEPTNGLDPLLRKRLYSMIEKERDRGTAILFSSHVLSEVERLCKKVGVMKEGILIKELSIGEIHKYTKKIVTIFGLKEKETLSDYKIIAENGKKHVFSIKRENLKEFLKKLNQIDYTDIEIRNPSLEESFMKLYSKGVA